MINHRRIFVAASCLLILGGCASGPRYDRSGRYGHRDSRPRDERADASRGEFTGLARELDGRAFRAREVAERGAAASGRNERELVGRLRDFSERAHEVRQQIDGGELGGARLRGSLDRLIGDARGTERAMRRDDVFAGLRDDWRGVMVVLDRMSSLAGS